MAKVSGGGLPRRAVAALWVCLAVAPGLAPRPSFAAPAATDASLEYAIKAADLLKFTKFIEWPADTLGAPDAAFNICIWGNNPFGEILDQVVSGEVAYGRKIAVQRLVREPAPGACQVLFVGSPEEAGAVGRPARGSGVLTVGEGEDFARNGGMIGFVIENRRVTFDINWQAAERAGLKLSSGLLGVARSVIR